MLILKNFAMSICEQFKILLQESAQNNRKEYTDDADVNQNYIPTEKYENAVINQLLPFIESKQMPMPNFVDFFSNGVAFYYGNVLLKMENEKWNICHSPDGTASSFRSEVFSFPNDFVTFNLIDSK